MLTVSSGVPCSDLESSLVRPTSLTVAPAPPMTTEALIREHGAFVWRSIRRLGVAAGDVDDVTQLVFLRARARLAEISQESAKGFLYRLALGLAKNQLRSQRRRRETSLDGLDADGDHAGVPRPSSDEPETRFEQRALLDRLLEPLSIELRAVLVLHEGEELTAPEIAELLGIPAGTVASRLRRARQEVKAALQRARARNPTFGGLP